MNDNPSNFRPQQSANSSQQYLDASIRMASPAKLRLMLIERAVEVASLLASQYRSGQKEGATDQSLKLMELFGELLSGVSGGANELENTLCLQVADLYVFLLQHLIAAEQTSDAQSIEEIQLVLRTEAETWRMAVAKESSQQVAARNPNFLASDFASTNATNPIAGGLNFSA